MSLTVSVSNNVKIFNVSSNKEYQLQDWIEKKHIKKLKKDPIWRQKVQLLQDMSFPEAALQISYTPDQRFIIASGVYKPQFRVFDLNAGTVLFERHVSFEILSQCILSEDWRKLAFLGNNRTVEFHGPSGMWDSIRIPKAGRHMIFDESLAELLIATNGNQVYRFNLDRGQFMAPLETNMENGINKIRVNKVNGLYGIAGDSGILEFWDHRNKKQVSCSTLKENNNHISDGALSIHEICFLPDGLYFLTGSSNGKINLHDFRQIKNPVNVLSHQSNDPIIKIEWRALDEKLVSVDKKSVKIWQDPRRNNCHSPWTTIESMFDINDLCLDKSSGLVMAACEGGSINSYFIPEFGPAPRWCSYLENITEELEEKVGSSNQFGNYKFITRIELESIGLSNLIGTKVIRPYMHGFFIDLKLYEKVKGALS